MQIKNYALISALVMIMMGLISFLPTMNVLEGLPPIYLNTSYGMFLDVFPMNILNKIALIIVGAMGLYAYFSPAKSLHHSIMYAKITFWIMGALALLGLFPQTNTLFGYWPLFGFEIILHAVFCLFSGYYGYVVTRETTFHPTSHHMHKV